MVANPAFYLDEFADEVLPSDLESCTLEGWAAWLAKGGDSGCEGWSFDPPEEGRRYSASSLKFQTDIELERLPDDDCEPRFRWSRPLDTEVDFAAIRFAPGAGWGPDDIICDTGSQDSVEAEIADPAWPKMEVGETALLAVAQNRTLELVYEANPPRLAEVTTQ